MVPVLKSVAGKRPVETVIDGNTILCVSDL
jgi:hypothetical protein